MNTSEEGKMGEISGMGLPLRRWKRECSGRNQTMEVSSRRENCLNTIRILAAFQVLLGHAVPWLGIPLTISGGLQGIVNELFLGVPIFYFLSGYLIWFSVENSKSTAQYLKKRFLRIYPELWVAVAVEIVVMLALYDQKVPIRDIVLFTGTQSTLFQFWTPDSLRMYGNGTPNGALWTISIIVQFYIVAWFLFRFLKKRKLTGWLVTMFVTAAIGVLLRLFEPVFPELVFKLIRNTFVPYLWLFLGGASVARYAEKILPVLEKYFYVFLLGAAFLIALNIDILSVYYNVVRSILIGAGWIGFAYRFPKLNIPIDFSYEIYLYHVTVINAMITLGFGGHIYDLLIVIAFSSALAIISKYTVGRIGIKKKMI